ncbi:hypothetical protein CY34DRAFT_19112 [Suillus luteus UH-Slu-Lm8-n1]|uniref:Uncharacterized protein n=1 Tax=Suillus luteus UH-Slu-Lm8-n1 TaxID=930992 RepID=A0A0D0ADR1_9AGAM|nr:hypothetical protein CY34DRAFT_19112 [Suillus luteus UH-Slu-Lm8-n1]
MRVDAWRVLTDDDPMQSSSDHQEIVLLMICQLPPPGIIAFDEVAYPYSDKPEGYMHKNIVVRYTLRRYLPTPSAFHLSFGPSGRSRSYSRTQPSRRHDILVSQFSPPLL